jgi:hypothetical protein
MMDPTELCMWLRANSSGIYRPAAEAADEIERLRGIVPEVLEKLNDDLCAENQRLRGLLAAERERLVVLARAALNCMEETWRILEAEFGPNEKTLDQECEDGDQPEIAALRALLRADAP